MIPVRYFAVATLLTLTAAAALAVHPQAWTHDREADFTEGRFDNTVLNSFGELALGRGLKAIGLPGQEEAAKKGAKAPGEQIDAVSAIVQGAGGTIYFSTAPKGTVYKLAEGKVSEFFTPDEKHSEVDALAVDGSGNVLVGASGDTAEILRIHPAAADAKPDVVWTDGATQYIWAMRLASDGTLYVGTGPHGKLIRIDAKGAADVLLETDAEHVMALAVDAKGRVVAGTASPGMVFRVDPAKKEPPAVLFDAGESDVNGVAIDKEGSIYFITGVATHEPASGEPSGAPAKPGKVEPNIGVPDVEPRPDPMKGRGELGGPQGIYAQAGPPLPKALARALEAAEAPDKPGAKEPKTADSGPAEGDKGSKTPGDHHHAEPETETGNALYQISPGGAVETLERFDNLIVTLAYLEGGELLVGEGQSGKIHSYQVAEQSETLIARVQEEAVTALAPGSDGSVLIGTTNLGALYSMTAGLATSGTYTSDVLDARRSADFGIAKMLATIPEGSKATLATRSGNVKDVERYGKFWSDWSAELPANADAPIKSPAARFLQYRITLTRDAKGDSPVIQQVRAVYQTENVAPKLKNLQVDVPQVESAESDEGDANDKSIDISWSASDDNEDTLVFYLYYRTAATGPWLLMARDVKEPHYAWKTKAIADGTYEVKVIASDSPDNPPETAKTTAVQSSPFVVDNTPPVIEGLEAKLDGMKVVITGTAKDATSGIVQVRYQIDADTDWHPAAASDKIFDSPSEGFSATTRALPAGNHRITVRATDSAGNTGYKAITVLVK